jgi:hypothetical protein
MKKISLLFAVSGMAMLSACAPLKLDQLPPRTPTDFLLDIKAVADENDFINLDVVGKRLRIDLVSGPEESVYASDGTTLLGYGIDVEQKGMASEYTSADFHYRIFRPKDRSFDRALVSLSVNTDVVCMTEGDLRDVFKKLNKNISPHVLLPSYSYDGQGKSDWTYFKFDSSGCLSRLGFFKNNGRK